MINIDLYLILYHADYQCEETVRNWKIRIGLNVLIVQANQRSQTRMGGWCVVQSSFPGTRVAVERLKMRDYIPWPELYNQVNPNMSLFPMT